MNDFASGVTSMARNCLTACELVEEGEWTIERMERWLKAVIENKELADLQRAKDDGRKV